MSDESSVTDPITWNSSVD